MRVYTYKINSCIVSIIYHFSPTKLLLTNNSWFFISHISNGNYFKCIVFVSLAKLNHGITLSRVALLYSIMDFYISWPRWRCREISGARSYIETIWLGLFIPISHYKRTRLWHRLTFIMGLCLPFYIVVSCFTWQRYQYYLCGMRWSEVIFGDNWYMIWWDYFWEQLIYLWQAIYEWNITKSFCIPYCKLTHHRLSNISKSSTQICKLVCVLHAHSNKGRSLYQTTKKIKMLWTLVKNFSLLDAKVLNWFTTIHLYRQHWNKPKISINRME